MECPAGSYCVAGEKVVCPLNSASKTGSDSIDDCVCDAGLSLVANTTCEVILPDTTESSSLWTPPVIAGVVVGSVVFVGGMVGGVWVVVSYTHPVSITPSINSDPAKVPLLP